MLENIFETDATLKKMNPVDAELDERATKILQSIETEAESCLREKYKVGSYSDPEEINQMYRLFFDFYEKKFEEYLKPIPILQLVGFMLGQYDRYFGCVSRGEPLPEEIPNTFGDSASVQKAILYSIERSLILENIDGDGLDEEEIAIHLRAVELCATRMCEWAASSDQVHGVYRNDTTVNVLPPGGPKFFSSRITPELKKEMEKIDTAIDQENIARKALLDGKDVPMDLDERRKVLDAVLLSELGVSFDDKRKILNSFVRDPFDHIHIISEDRVLDFLEEKTKFSRPIIKKVIDGLLITKQKISGDNPIWLINARENRITRRPIIGFNLADGFHYAWAKSMTTELLNYFNGLMVFRGFPSEWCIGSVQQSIEDLSQSVSQWFEDEYIRLMKERGFIGRRVNGSIGKLQIPLGEIDYLSFNNDLNLLLVSECKLVKWSSDPRQCFDDYQQFVDTRKPGKKSYSEVLKEKYDWIIANSQDVIEALHSEFPEIKPTGSVRTAAIIVTYNPMRVSLLIQDVACKSLVQFIQDLDEKKDWPYSEGVT